MKKLIFIFLALFFSINLFSKDIMIKKSSSGLIYSVYKVNSRISAINVLIRAGSIYDPQGKYGLANFLASMLKKGGTLKYSSDKLFNSLDKYGIELFTSASKDFIKVGIKFINDYKTQALEIFTEILFHPAFNYNEFLAVKKEIIGQIKSLQNNNDYLAIHKGFLKLIKNSDFSHTTTGTIKDIKSITIKDLKNYYKKYFTPKNIIVSFCGDFNENEVKNIIEKNFSFNGRDKKFKAPLKKLKFTDKSEKVFYKKPLKQSYIYILFPSQGYLGEDYYAIKVLSFILGGNLTSILPIKIRKEKGLAYSIFSTNYSTIEGGVFVIGLQTENKNREMAIKTILKVLDDLKGTGISNKMIENAKNFFEGSIYIGLQSTYALSSSISNGIFLGKSMPPWEYDLKMIKKVTKKQIDKLIREIFEKKRMVVSIVGDVK